MRLARCDSGMTILVFHLPDHLVALPVEAIERIAPMAELAHPPGVPAAVEGILNLGGAAIPVLRLDRLFGLPPQRLSLHSMLIVLRAAGAEPGAERVAILTDRALDIQSVAEENLQRITSGDAFNGCVEATTTIRDRAVHILSPARLMLAKERRVLAEFQAMAQQRLAEWTVASA